MLGVEWDLSEANDWDILSFHELEMTSVVAFHDEEMAELSCVSKSIVAFGFFGTTVEAGLTCTGAEETLFSPGESFDLLLSSLANFPVPMNSIMAFPREFDNDVGGVLTKLLEPGVVDAKADDIEEDDDEVDGELKTLGGTAVIPFAA